MTGIDAAKMQHNDFEVGAPLDQGSLEGEMGFSLVFRPLLLSIIHFEKDTSERNGNTQTAKNNY